MPIAIQLWLGGVGVLWLAAKAHFFFAFGGDSAEYVGRHWPFWAAMVGWGLVGAYLMRRFGWGRRSD